MTNDSRDYECNRIEFSITENRFEVIIKHHKELAQVCTKHLSSEAPQTLIEAYELLDDAYVNLINEEAKFLSSLK